MAVQAQDIFESSFHCRLALGEDIDVQDNIGGEGGRDRECGVLYPKDG